MSQTLVAVIDIGKTNKKVILFDQDLRLVADRQKPFPSVPGSDGFQVEPVEAIEAWIWETLGELYREHPFRAISVSTHGATWALIDDQGLTAPVIAYDTALTEHQQADLDAAFYTLAGPLEKLQEETATCDLPLLINPAKALLLLEQRRPGTLARSQHLINYPQYWGWRLTGKIGAEPTYTANHSFLFDIRRRQASSAAKALGAAHLVNCDLKQPWDQLGLVSAAVQKQTGLPAIPVTLGIHDSNAALLPYLVAMDGHDFVLNSTGTWCVALHRVNEVRYRPEELGQKVIFNLDAFGHLQKSSFLMGGQDYGLYHDLIGGERAPFDAARLNAALARTGDMFLPGAFPSQFPKVHGGATEGGKEFSLNDLRAGRKPSWMADPVLAHDLLIAGLALQSEVALRRCDLGAKTEIYVEGGFRNNPIYLAVLTALFADAEVSCTSLAQATATGAAMLAQALVAGRDPSMYRGRFSIEKNPIERLNLPNLAAYRRAFLDRCS